MNGAQSVQCVRDRREFRIQLCADVGQHRDDDDADQAAISPYSIAVRQIGPAESRQEASS